MQTFDHGPPTDNIFILAHFSGFVYSQTMRAALVNFTTADGHRSAGVPKRLGELEYVDEEGIDRKALL